MYKLDIVGLTVVDLGVLTFMFILTNNGYSEHTSQLGDVVGSRLKIVGDQVYESLEVGTSSRF
jgi:hypothetical protein